MGEQQEVLARWVVAAGRQLAVGGEQRVVKAHLLEAGAALLQMVSVM